MCPVKNHNLLQEDQNNGCRNNYIRFSVITMLTRGVFGEARHMSLTNEMHCGTLMLMSAPVPDLASLFVLAGLAGQGQQTQNYSKYVVVFVFEKV